MLGIDPGLNATGYGVIVNDGGVRALVHGVIRPSARAPMGDRLLTLYRALLDVLRANCPDAVAIEEPFVGENTRSALALGRAQSVAWLAAAEVGAPVFTYAPAQVKSAVAGYGRSDKRQVADMVRMQLGMAATPEPPDVTDALAVALCHAAHASQRMVEMLR